MERATHPGRKRSRMPFGGLIGAAILVASSLPAAAQSSVSIRAGDGGVISGDIYGTGTRGVVLAHGGRFDRASWRDQALELADSGFLVLAIDFRAAVEARAGRETSCLYDEVCLAKDVIAAMFYLRAAGAQTVSLIGASLGGGATAQAAVESAAGTIDGIVLLAHMPIAEPERMQGRKLFIVSRDDRGSGDVPRLPAIQAQYEKATGPRQILILDGSAHAQFIFQTEQGPRAMREIVRFLSSPLTLQTGSTRR